MSTLGALFGSAIISLIACNVIGFPGLFWVLFLICAVPSALVGLIMDGRSGARHRQEVREDKRHHEQLEAIKQAIAAGQQVPGTTNNLNIDARSVHYHPENKAQKRLVDKP